MKRSSLFIATTLLLIGGSCVILDSLGRHATADDVATSLQPTVVELFTSQGCSSCPSADRTLATIRKTAREQNLPVHVMSFHVDYWDAIGWKDPFASPQNTERQRRYAKVLQTGRVYTPQMIVGGTTEFVGSNGKLATKAIERSLRNRRDETLALHVETQPTGNELRVRYDYQGDASGKIINLALVQPETSNAVARGENAGRKLVHVNVVRDFETSTLRESGELSLAIPEELRNQSLSIIGYIQNVNDAAIVTSTQKILP